MWVPSISRIINSRAGRKVRWHSVSKTVLQNRPLSLTDPPTQLISQFYALLLHPVEMFSLTHFTVLSWISYKSIPLTNCESLQGMNIMLVCPVPRIVSDILENIFFSESHEWRFASYFEVTCDYLCLLILKIICIIFLFPSNYLSNLKSHIMCLNRISFQLAI